MKRTIVFLLLVIFIGGLLSPFSAFAGQYKDEDDNLIIYEGLVPCGKTSHESGESALVMAPCQFCHLFVMINEIVSYFLIYILGPIIVLMILVAGIMFYFAGGNPNLLTQAKALITSVVIGVVIILCSYLIIGTVLNVMGVSEANPLSGWATDGVFVIKCPIQGPSSSPTNNINNTTDDGNIGGEEDGAYSDPNTLGDLVTKTRECEGPDEIATSGECIPVDQDKTIVISQGISDDNKGYTCTFRGEVKSTSAGIDTFYSPEVVIDVTCVDESDYIPSNQIVYEDIYSNSNTFGIPLEETLECKETGEIAKGGACIPVDEEKTEAIGPGTISSDSKGYTCTFKGKDNPQGSEYTGFYYPPEGVIKVYCEIE